MKILHIFYEAKAIRRHELYIFASLGMYGGERNKSPLTKLIKAIYKVKIQHNISLEKNSMKLILRKN